MYKKLKEINTRPAPFQYYTADELWTNEHTSKKMLEYHLNETIDAASRNSEFIEKSVNWILSNLKLNKNSKVADFGCGPGLYSSKLADQGINVTGIDFSKSSISYAKQVSKNKDLKINYVLNNYLDFETQEKFDLILMIMCDFSALSLEQRNKMLGKFYRFLEKRGAVLLDVYSLNYFNKKEETAFYELNQLNKFWSPNNYYAFVNTYKYKDEKVILDKYTIFEETKERVVYNWLQCFSEESLKKEFENAGFTVDSLYSNVAGERLKEDSLEIAIVAKK